MKAAMLISSAAPNAVVSKRKRAAAPAKSEAEPPSAELMIDCISTGSFQPGIAKVDIHGTHKKSATWYCQAYFEGSGFQGNWSALGLVCIRLNLEGP
jgi:hypothetical protein